ncbi:hypothetical protein GDO78_016808 [Eleutherodactylus coqui]|uniref:Uncharacterized protein n=1 Tax=Eleutherodactylus coqui TaxID=57060 RepID=A0A8J6C312_ELECQ|nr:hypothetical protein GDO78_016808 [Eleutherodactylus coqui]
MGLLASRFFSCSDAVRQKHCSLSYFSAILRRARQLLPMGELEKKSLRTRIDVQVSCDCDAIFFLHFHIETYNFCAHESRIFLPKRMTLAGKMAVLRAQ